MKKGIWVIIIIIFADMTAISVSAQEKTSYVGESYANYEACEYDKEMEDDILLYAASVQRTKYVTFNKIIVPPTDYFYRESVNGSYYSGFLQLTGYRYSNGQTIATYSGLIYKE